MQKYYQYKSFLSSAIRQSVPSSYFYNLFRIFPLAIALSSFTTPAFADKAERQEIEALKAQLKQLEAHIQSLENRQNKGNTSTKTRSKRKTYTQKSNQFQATHYSDNNRVSNSRKPVDPSNLIPSGQNDLVTSASNPNDSFVKDNTPPHPHTLSLDSSSPLAITQTNVQNLPPIFTIGGISVKIGGFVEMTNIYRDKNMVSGPLTLWNKFPYKNDPNSRIDEDRFSAQNTRLSTLLEGHPDKRIGLQAYVESDFVSAGTTSNSISISGYTPRLRQGYFELDDSEYGLHFVGGQAWSLVTNYSKGLLPRNEQLPPVMDNNQIPGVPFTRSAQFRFVKDWNKKYWLGLSFENPEHTADFSDTVVSGGTLPIAFGRTKGATIIFNNNGSGSLNPNAKYSLSSVPDIVTKAAVDTSFGHYEIFGLARWFRTQSATDGSKNTTNNSKMGGGIGANALVPAYKKFVQLSGSIFAGQGIGRYDAIQIPDITFTGDGKPTPVPELIANMGLITHPRSDLLIYTYGSVDAAGRRTYLGADGKEHGYGARSNNLSGCGIEFGICNAQTKTLAAYTLGGWWHALDGSYGNVLTGFQYTYIRKFAFKGNNGYGNSLNPATNGNTIYLSVRYFPFQ